MEIKHYPIQKLKKEILEIVGKYLDLNLYRVFFFGSRITKKNTERSDIDLGIEGPEPVPLAILEKIKEEIENLPILYKIEIVDFKRVSSDFRKLALESVELVN